MITKHPQGPKTKEKLQESNNDKDTGYPHQDREDAGDSENDQGALPPRPLRVLAEDLMEGCQSVGRGRQEEGERRTRAWGCEKKNPERNPRKLRNESLAIPTPLVAPGVDVPSIFQARARPRRVGLQQEVGALRLPVPAAAAVAEGDTCR